MPTSLDVQDARSACIEVGAVEPAALFHPHDPTPLADRALDERIEAYIVRKATLQPLRAPLTIRLTFGSDPATATAGDGPARGGLSGGALERAVRRHFTARHAEITQDLTDTTRRGLSYLGMGMSLLTVCMVLGWLGKTYVFREPYGSFIETGLSVFGWVANWRPVETLLYERLLVRRRLNLYARLARSAVMITGDQV